MPTRSWRGWWRPTPARPIPRRRASSMPRAGSTSSASTPTTTRASSSPSRSTSASRSRCVPTDDRRVEVTLAATGERDGFDLDAIGAKRGAWIDYVAGTAWALARGGRAGARASGRSSRPTCRRDRGCRAPRRSSWRRRSRCPAATRPAVDRMTLARIAQRAENAYVGVNCGLMDQFASAFGEPGSALLLDCRTLEHRAVPLPLDGVGARRVPLGSPRRLESSAYNERRAQCEAAVATIAAVEPGVTALRDVTPAMLEAHRGRTGPARRRPGGAHRPRERAGPRGRRRVRGRRPRRGGPAVRREPRLDARPVRDQQPGARRAGRDRVRGRRRVSARGSPAPASAAARSTSSAATRRRRCARRSSATTRPRTGLTPRVFEVEPSRGAAVLRG